MILGLTESKNCLFIAFYFMFEINFEEFFTSFSRSMMNQVAKIELLIVLGFLKRLDGLNFSDGATHVFNFYAY